MKKSTVLFASLLLQTFSLNQALAQYQAAYTSSSASVPNSNVPVTTTQQGMPGYNPQTSQTPVIPDQGVSLNMAKTLGGLTPPDCTQVSNLNQGIDNQFLSILQQSASKIDPTNSDWKTMMMNSFGVQTDLSKQKAASSFVNSCDADLKSLASGLVCPMPDKNIFPKKSGSSSSSSGSKSSSTASADIDYTQWENYYNSLLDSAQACKQAKISNATAALGCYDKNISWLNDKIKLVKADFDMYLKSKEIAVKVIDQEIATETEAKKQIDKDFGKYSNALGAIESVLPETMRNGDKESKYTGQADRNNRQALEQKKSEHVKKYKEGIRSFVTDCMGSNSVNGLGLTPSPGSNGDADQIASMKVADAAREIFRRDRVKYYVEVENRRPEVANQIVARELATFNGDMQRFIGTDFFMALNDVAAPNVSPEAVFNTDVSKLLSFKSNKLSPSAAAIFSQSFNACMKLAKQSSDSASKANWETEMKNFTNDLMPYQNAIDNVADTAAGTLGIPATKCGRHEEKTSDGAQRVLSCMEKSVETLRQAHDHYKPNPALNYQSNGMTSVQCEGLLKCVQQLSTTQKNSETRISNLKDVNQLAPNDPLCMKLTPCMGKKGFVAAANESVEKAFGEAGGALKDHVSKLQTQINALEANFSGLGVNDLPDLMSDDDSQAQACSNAGDEKLCKIKTPFEKALLGNAGMKINDYKRYIKSANNKLDAKKKENERDLASAKQEVKTKMKSCEADDDAKKRKKLTAASNKYKNSQSALEKAMRNCQDESTFSGLSDDIAKAKRNQEIEISLKSKINTAMAKEDKRYCFPDSFDEMECLKNNSCTLNEKPKTAAGVEVDCSDLQRSLSDTRKGYQKISGEGSYDVDLSAISTKVSNLTKAYNEVCAASGSLEECPDAPDSKEWQAECNKFITDYVNNSGIADEAVRAELRRKASAGVKKAK